MVYILDQAVRLTDSVCSYEIQITNDNDLPTCDAYIKDKIQGLKHEVDELEKAIAKHKETKVQEEKGKSITTCGKLYSVRYSGEYFLEKHIIFFTRVG